MIKMAPSILSADFARLLEDVKKITGELKCYDGLNGYKQTNTGFVVAFKISDNILDLSTKGNRPRKITVTVSGDRVESMRDYIIPGEDERNIVGLSSLVNSAKDFRRKNNLASISMEVSLLEIKDCKKMYIQMVNYILIR